MGTSAYPSDPVTNGATAIQSTTFANVAADYAWTSHEAAKAYLDKKKGIRYFPGKPAGWQFYMRADLSGGTANLRNVIGVRVTHLDASDQYFASGVGNITIPLQDVEVEVSNWAPIQRTLSDSAIVTRFKLFRQLITLSIDPETGDIYNVVGETRLLDEAGGFLLLRAAATTPVLTPALKALGAAHPLV
jgi:hypothetical protein